MINVRTKGHSFERRVAILFHSIFPEAKRHLEMQMSDCIGIDLDNTGELAIQCKKGKQVPKTIYGFYNQILVDRKGKKLDHHKIKTVVMARDNEEILVVVSLKDFKDILNGRIVIT